MAAHSKKIKVARSGFFLGMRRRNQLLAGYISRVMIIQALLKTTGAGDYLLFGRDICQTDRAQG